MFPRIGLIDQEKKQRGEGEDFLPLIPLRIALSFFFAFREAEIVCLLRNHKETLA